MAGSQSGCQRRPGRRASSVKSVLNEIATHRYKTSRERKERERLVLHELYARMRTFDRDCFSALVAFSTEVPMRLIGLVLTLSLTLAQLAATAQQPVKAPRIGMLLSGTLVDPDPRVAAFRQALRGRGYVDGQNIAIEPRGSDDIPRLYDLATDLVQSKVDVIVTQGTPGVQAAQRATRTTPIVMAASGDAVKLGLVASLARPGGNITGQTIIAAEYIGKRLEILRAIVPSVSRIAILWNPGNPGLVDQMKAAEDAARTLGVALQRVEARRPDELERAFQAARNGRAGALLVTDDAVLNTHRARIASLAAASRLPTIYGLRTAEAGGFLSYGPNLLEMFRSAAIYVDKILKGAKPADLPIEQPTKFELVINLKTAKALGLTIPQSLLLRADEVIQ